MKQSGRPESARGGTGAAVARGACLAAVLLALLVLGREIGMGIGAVKRGEMTAAEMLTDLGEWMRGQSNGE